MRSHGNNYLRTWFHEFGSVIRNPKELLHHKLIRQTGVLLSGDAGARLLSLVSLTLTVRAIGAELFGILVVAEAYAKLIDRIFNFQSWSGIIRFGAQAIQDGNTVSLKRYIKLGISLDVASSLLGSLIAFFIAPFVVKILKWDPSTLIAIQVYSFLIMFNFTGTAVGVLRLAEMFSLLAWQRIFYASIKFIAILFCWFFNKDFMFFLFSWMISEILGYLFVIGAAVNVIKSRKWFRTSSVPNASNNFSLKPFVHFILWTNLSSTVDIPTKFLDMFIVSSLVSFEAAGAYKVFQQIGHVLKKPMEPFYQVVYPHFSNTVAKGLPGLAIKNAFRGMFFTLVIVALVLIASVVSSFWWLPAMFGKEFARFLPDFATYMVITGLSVVFTNINPLFMALGFVRENFLIQTVANLAFIVMAWIGATHLGLRGFLIALGINILISFGAKTIVIVRNYKGS